MSLRRGVGRAQTFQTGLLAPCFMRDAGDATAWQGSLVDQTHILAMLSAQRLAGHGRAVADCATGDRRAGHGGQTATLVSDDGSRAALGLIGDRPFL